MLIKFVVFALASGGVAGLLPDPELTADQGELDARSDEYVCLSTPTVEAAFKEVGEEEEEEDPLTMYCLAKCTGEHARPDFVPAAGPTTPAEIVKEHSFWDPYKWCAFVAEKTCKQLGDDHKLAESCFGARL